MPTCARPHDDDLRGQQADAVRDEEPEGAFDDVVLATRDRVTGDDARARGGARPRARRQRAMVMRTRQQGPGALAARRLAPPDRGGSLAGQPSAVEPP